MRFCGGRQQISPGLLVHVQSGVDHVIDTRLEELREAAGGKVPGGDPAEYGNQDVVVELGDCQGDEVPFEPRRDITSARRRTHRAHQLDIHKSDRHYLFPVVPGPMIEPLAQKFDGGLRPEYFFLRHRHVVHENHPVLAGRRTIYTF